MKHRYYALTKGQQRLFLFKLTGLLLGFNLLIAMVLLVSGLAFLSLFIFALSLSVFAPFVDVPSGVKNGSLVYYSPLLIAEKIKHNAITLHSGSLFDYYFSLDFTQSAQARKKQVFQAYVDGLLTLINQYEHQPPDHIQINATSYILNPRTARKLGLQITKTNLIQQFILYFNFINLTCALSLLKGQLTLPKMNQIYSFNGQLSTLIANKPYLLKLKEKLKETHLKQTNAG